MSYFFKVGLRINGVSRTVDYVSSKTAVDYANAFKNAFDLLFPAFTFSVTTGGVLQVEAPEGTQLVITPFGDKQAFTPQVSVRSSKVSVAPPVVVLISSGVANQLYRISLDGKPFTYTTGATPGADWHSDNIAESFRAFISQQGFVVQRFSNLLIISKSDGTKIKFGVSDSFNNTSIKAYQGSVPTEADLPPWLDETVVLAVGTTKEGGYYVRYVHRDSVTGQLTSPSTTNYQPYTRSDGTYIPGWSVVEGTTSGFYEETWLPGVPSVFNPETMPHVLVREADGSFTFKQADWGRRTVGDELSVPAPSFAGKPIQDLFFFRNRLGILTDDSLVFSRAGKFFDFWPETAKDVLDTDPIDVQVGSERVSRLNYAVPFNATTMLFGENSQFIVTAQGNLTPRSITVQPSTNFSMSPKVRPLAMGPSVYFVADRDPWSALWEYYVQEGTFSNTAQEVSLHAPRYIPAGVHQLVGSPAAHMVLCLNPTNRKAIQVYQYLWMGDQKAQSAWGTWTFNGEVLNAAFMGSKIYLAIRRLDGVYLERIDLLEPIETALVDRKGHEDWESYDMVYEFSPVYLTNQQGNLTAGRRKLKTVSVSHSGLGWLHIGVLPQGRDIVWRTYPDQARDSIHQGDRSLGTLRAAAHGDSASTRVILLNNSNAQTVINSAEFELTQDQRARRV